MTPQIVSFVKALGITLVVAIAAFFSNPANLVGILPVAGAGLVSALAAAFETYLKEQSGGTTALFGSVTLK